MRCWTASFVFIPVQLLSSIYPSFFPSLELRKIVYIYSWKVYNALHSAPACGLNQSCIFDCCWLKFIFLKLRPKTGKNTLSITLCVWKRYIVGMMMMWHWILERSIFTVYTNTNKINVFVKKKKFINWPSLLDVLIICLIQAYDDPFMYISLIFKWWFMYDCIQLHVYTYVNQINLSKQCPN